MSVSIQSILELKYIRRNSFKDADQCDIAGCHKISRYNAREYKAAKAKVHLCKKHKNELVDAQLASSTK